MLLDVTMRYYMLCSVVTCYQELLHAVQCCYMLHYAVEFRAAMLNVVLCPCMLRSVVTYCQKLLHAV